MSNKHRKAAKKTNENAKNDEGLQQEVQKKDKSPHVHQKEKLKYSLTIRERDDFTERQKAILETMLHKNTRCVFVDGVYGSGKTFAAVLASLKLLDAGKVDQILYIRNPVESSSVGHLGFIPGTIDEKFSVYTVPLVEKLEEMLPANEITSLLKEKRIECVPLGYVRGRNWNCKAVIVDEASSMSYSDLILLLTRCGNFCRIFLIGDSANQNDIGAKSGFRQIFDKFNDEESMNNGVFAFELRQSSDVVRSPFVRFLMTHLGILKEGSAIEVSEPMFPPK